MLRFGSRRIRKMTITAMREVEDGLEEFIAKETEELKNDLEEMEREGESIFDIRDHEALGEWEIAKAQVRLDCVRKRIKIKEDQQVATGTG